MKNCITRSLVTGETVVPVKVRGHKFDLSDLSDLLISSGYYKVFDVKYSIQP